MKRIIAAIFACTLFPLAFASEQTLSVSAAASLTNAYAEIGTAFEAKHPDKKVEFNFAASGVLLQQILNGAPVDVFASADQATMDKAQEEKAIKEATRIDFIGNGLVLIAPIDSSLVITSLNDLRSSDIRYIAMGNPDTTPNARYAKAAMEQAGVWAAVEPKLVVGANVRQSLNYVSKGEAEVGFVFSTDAKQDEGKVKVELVVPTVTAGEKAGEWVSSPIVYPIAVTASSKNPLAEEFIQFVLSAEGQSILAKYGFLPIQEMTK